MLTGSAHHLVLGGQRSGKSRYAERVARAWLSEGAEREVVMLVTALAGDDEMRARIKRHQQDRPADFITVEEPCHLDRVLADASSPNRMVVVDCLTLWLTNVLMPAAHARDECDMNPLPPSAPWPDVRSRLLATLDTLPGPVVLVSNEIGWGVIPLGSQVRQFVDELGRLNQDVAQCCGHITLMAAGQAWTQPVERWT